MRFVWPTPNQENWRYTNVSKLANIELSEASSQAPAALPSNWGEFLADGFDSSLIFWNGKYCSKLSRVSNAFKLSVTGKLATGETELDEINEALVKESYSIEISKKVVQPIAMLFLNSSDSQEIQIHASRIQVRLEKFAEASILEIHAGIADTESLIETHISEMALNESSHLEHVFLNMSAEGSKAFFRKQCEQAKHSVLRSMHIDLGGDLSRTDTFVNLNEIAAEAFVNGVYLNERKQHTDHHGVIRHVAPETLSHQLFKGILTDQSRAVFNAKVRIEQTAPKSNAEQLNKNLVMSSKSEIDSLPRLEIFNDDVKATHGSASGQIDQDQVFYLVSRGIPHQAAMQMLVEAYAFEMLDNVTSVIAKKLTPLISEKLKNFKGEVKQ